MHFLSSFIMQPLFFNFSSCSSYLSGGFGYINSPYKKNVPHVRKSAGGPVALNIRQILIFVNYFFKNIIIAMLFSRSNPLLIKFLF